MTISNFSSIWFELWGLDFSGENFVTLKSLPTACPHQPLRWQHVPKTLASSAKQPTWQNTLILPSLSLFIYSFSPSPTFPPLLLLFFNGDTASCRFSDPSESMTDNQLQLNRPSYDLPLFFKLYLQAQFYFCFVFFSGKINLMLICY